MTVSVSHGQQYAAVLTARLWSTICVSRIVRLDGACESSEGDEGLPFVFLSFAIFKDAFNYLSASWLNVQHFCFLYE
jgi:hypothetical protein